MKPQLLTALRLRVKVSSPNSNLNLARESISINDVHSLSHGVHGTKQIESSKKEAGRIFDQFVETQEHNRKVLQDYVKGEEGVDYIFGNYDNDPNTLTENKLNKLAKKHYAPQLKQLKDKIKELSGTSKDPEHLRKLELLKLKDVKPSDIKEYPGGPNGPFPEDNKDHYLNWLDLHMPEPIKRATKEVLVPEELKKRKMGPKMKNIAVQEEYIHNSNEWYYFRHYDKEFRLDDQRQLPAWEILLGHEDEKAPHYTYYSWSSMTPAQETEPHPEQVYDYDEYDELVTGIDQRKYKTPHKSDNQKLMQFPSIPYNLPFEHNQLVMASSKWAALEAYPTMHYSYNQLQGIYVALLRSGELKKPKLPSLWAYYETLPSWCTDNPIVQSAVLALEVSISY